MALIYLSGSDAYKNRCTIAIAAQANEIPIKSQRQYRSASASCLERTPDGIHLMRPKNSEQEYSNRKCQKSLLQKGREWRQRDESTQIEVFYWVKNFSAKNRLCIRVGTV